MILFSLSLQGLAGPCDSFELDQKRLFDKTYLVTLPETIIGHYQQPRPMDKDLLADFSLFSKAQSTPIKMWWELTKNHKAENAFIARYEQGRDCANILFEKTYVGTDLIPVTEEDFKPRSSDIAQILDTDLSDELKIKLINDLEQKKFYIEGKKNPVKVKPFVLMVNQIIQEELANGITPKIGQVHVWSSEIKKSKEARGSWVLACSKILVALARGETSQYLVTGKEAELEDWMIQRPMRSVEAHDLIRQSYRLNSGDMYLTLLTIENVLSRFWRHEKREYLPITLRLKPFVSTLGGHGDLFGSWYHFFGVMLYGYVAGAFKAKLIGSIETIGSHLLAGFEDEHQEDYVNSHGGEIGAKIKKSILKKSYEKIVPGIFRLDSSYYFDISEDFEKQLKKKAHHL